MCVLSVAELINGKCLSTQVYPKKAQELFLSRETTSQSHPALTF